MLATEKIHQYVQLLLESLQVEVLDFIEYLLSKAEREVAKQDELDWSGLSLQPAMRGMEDEEAPMYTPSDLKVVFS